jgi:hypothetical protein
MAKHVARPPEWLNAPHIVDVFSVSDCIARNFADYIPYWRHNGYWLFDSSGVITQVARENSISLSGTRLFYYEAYEKEFDGKNWRSYDPETSIPTNVIIPSTRKLEGFDVANFTGRNVPECSGLSCSSLAEKLPTNLHCLFNSFNEAEALVSQGAFNDSEPGPYRIFAVYAVDWETEP